MLISYNWLKDLIDLSQHSFETVIEKLTMGGLEVEGVEDMSAALTGVIVAQVLEKKQHPDADRLSLCLVDQGNEQVPVVCGAQNFEAGDYVAFAPVGTVLGEDFKIKKAKIRGEVSLGMICSEKELALSEQHDGIMKLTSGNLLAGTKLSTYLGHDDRIIEVGVTPNRPDALSHLGVARELAVSF